MKKILLSFAFASIGAIAFAQPVTVSYNYTGTLQSFTVPSCVSSLRIEVRGAQGGAVTGQSPFPQGGLGATMIGDFVVTPGDVLDLIVGGRGNSDPSSSGGGGGTGVNLLGNALIVAGGGAGVDFQDPFFAGQDAVISSAGVTGNGGGGAGGSGGTNGGDNIYSGTNISRGGNGWLVAPAGSFGANGVSTNTTFTAGTWGLGGGGGSVGYGWCNCGGGGGGYSGGGSGQINQTGGGGGSFNSGTNQVNTGGSNTGDGFIIITYTVSGSLPASPASITGPSNVCIGSGPVTYSIASVVGATSYTWGVPAGSTITNGQGTTTITIQPGSTSGNITVTSNNTCGSSTPATLALTINPLPVVNLGADFAQCPGNVTLDAQNVGSTYVWSDASTNQTLNVSSSGTYSVVVTDANGCSNSDAIVATFNPLPVVNLGSDFSQCAGTYTFDAQNAGSTYLWSDASTNQTLTVSTTGTYSVVVTDANGCVNSDAITATFNPLPVVALGNDITQCGGTVTFDAQNVGSSYLWSDASTGQTITVSTSGTYSVTVTDVNGCMNSDAVVATINALPVVNLGPDIIQCGGSYLFDAQNQGSTYLWNDASTGQTLVAFASGTYYVEVMDANGCIGSDTVIATLGVPPTVTGTASSTSVCLSDAPVLLTGTPAGGVWSGPGVTGSSFSPSAAGAGTQSVVYNYTDPNSCIGSASVVITVSACVGVDEQFFQNGFNVYPNPNDGMFTLAVNTNVETLQIVITDLQGRVVYSSEMKNVNAGYIQQINLETETAGMYLMQISGNGEQRVEKISVQK